MKDKVKIQNKILSSVLLSFILFFICFSRVSIAANETWALVNEPVANLYVSPKNNASLASQAIYNTSVQVLEAKGGFVLVKTPDGYEGWMDKKSLVFRINRPRQHIAKVKNLFANVYQDATTTSHQPIFILPFAARLFLIKADDERWLEVLLADGRSGWIQRGDVDIDPKPLTMAGMLALSRKFVGLPYMWGGVSTYGFDCSGFVQMLYQEMGINLPRDGEMQVEWPEFIDVSRENLRPGDLLYFGWDNKISHAAVYLGDNKFIGSTAYENPTVQICDLRLPHWRDIFIAARRLNTAASSPELKFFGRIQPIPLSVEQQMRQYSWHEGCPVPLKNLAYLTLSYWGFDSKPHRGNMVVRSDVAEEVKGIFQKLYEERFPIEKMQLIDVYHGDDEAAMADNNTSAFNCRAMTDFKNQYSLHSYGLAIDINPLINPYVNHGKVQPREGAKYLDRHVYYKGKIVLDSKAYQAFTSRGWVWGGAWSGKIQDYQHFEKTITIQPVDRNAHYGQS